MARKPKKPKPAPWSLAAELAALGPRPDDPSLQPAWKRRYDAAVARDRQEQDLKRRQDRNKLAKKAPDGYRDVAGYQESHSPTDDYVVRGDIRVSADGKVARETIAQTRRRRAHAILMNILSAEQTQASEEIEIAVEMMPGIGRIRGQVFERQSRTTAGGPEAQAMVKLQQAYFDWARALQGLGISHAAAFDIIVQGKTLDQVDGERRKRHGWSKQHYIAALDMWAITRGWRRGYTPEVQAFADAVKSAPTVHEAMKKMEEMPMDQGRVPAPGADSGRTLAMVKDLPETGAVVVVHLEAHRGYIEDMIAGIRPAARAATRVVAIPTEEAAIRLLGPQRSPVYIDHSFWALAPVLVARKTAYLARTLNARFGDDTAGASEIARAIRLGDWDILLRQVREIHAECLTRGRVDLEKVKAVARDRKLTIPLVTGADAEDTLMRSIAKAVIPEGWTWAFAATRSGPAMPVLLEERAP